jgi:hypothetical protein
VADTNVGMEKYSLTGTTWTAEGTVALVGISGLTGTVSNGTVYLYATDPSSLVEVTDAVGTGTLSGSPTTLSTAPTDEAYRGVAFAPTSLPTSLPEAPLTIGLPLTAAVLAGGAWTVLSRRRRTA